jgi:hypothetical protein
MPNPNPNPNLKVKDEDNIFLKSMELMVIIATKDNNTKVIPLSYRSRCLICKEEFDAFDILNAKHACLMHIVQKHRDAWINIKENLLKDKQSLPPILLLRKFGCVWTC